MALSGLAMIGVWLLVGLPVLVTLRWLDGRRWTAWRFALGDDGRLQLAYLARQSAAQVRVVRATYDFALARRDEGDGAEALRLLDAGSRLIQRFAPDMVAQLRHLLDLSRAVSALAPVRPLRPPEFRLWRLRGLATLALFGHAVLITTTERFRLKVRVLMLAFRIIVRGGRDAAARAREDPSGAWHEIDALGSDLGTLRRESLDVVQALLVSLEREHAKALAVRAVTY